MHDRRTQGLARARTLFLSDIHLGYKCSRARELLDFLRSVEAECIVLVGDIVDALSLAKRFFWPPEHTEVLRLLLARRRAGARLVYLPGNHDEGLGILADMLNGQLEVHREWVHRTARGVRFLVMHGDQLEETVACPAWLYQLGDALYEGALAVNHRLNNARLKLGRPYWPIAERLKLALPTSARYIARYERIAAAHAAAQGFDGVICGHIHRANLCRIDGTIYANTGDWVESCSALIEDSRGELWLQRWPARLARPAAARARASLALDAAPIS
ncbi:MAG TPA: UDP-2,3-diacylglucosamine diphosphatase [Steroidobacteraceae bacterium]|nr:UDP-2,3-diacylglucosamine diphosphatase [Steroidobacteraceae bacterium]